MTNPTLLNICLLTFTTTKVMTVFQFLSFLFFLSLNCTAQSQYYYNGLDQTLEFRVYTNLHFATREPELVYRFKKPKFDCISRTTLQIPKPAFDYFK